MNGGTEATGVGSRARNCSSLRALQTSSTPKGLPAALHRTEAHLCQTSNLFDADIESEQVQGLLAHCRQTGHWGAPLFHECQVTVDPQLPLRLVPQLIDLCDLLPSGGRRAGLLVSGVMWWRARGQGWGRREKGKRRTVI